MPRLTDEQIPQFMDFLERIMHTGSTQRISPTDVEYMLDALNELRRLRDRAPVGNVTGRIPRDFPRFRVTPSDTPNVPTRVETEYHTNRGVYVHRMYAEDGTETRYEQPVEPHEPPRQFRGMDIESGYRETSFTVQEANMTATEIAMRREQQREQARAMRQRLQQTMDEAINPAVFLDPAMILREGRHILTFDPGVQPPWQFMSKAQKSRKRAMSFKAVGNPKFAVAIKDEDYMVENLRFVRITTVSELQNLAYALKNCLMDYNRMVGAGLTRLYRTSIDGTIFVAEICEHGHLIQFEGPLRAKPINATGKKGKKLAKRVGPHAEIQEKIKAYFTENNMKQYAEPLVTKGTAA